MRARGDRSHRAEGAAEYRRHGPRPGRVVVVGPDHFHGNFYDVMPPFSLGVEQAVGFGDFGSRSGPLPVAAELAWSVHSGLSAAGFDLALSYSLTVDHGIVQGYEMITAGCSVPMVPLVVNTAAPPLPALERCVGLSHWLPSNDPRDPSVTGDRRVALIHGRRDAEAFAAAREPRVRALGGDPTARVNADWDRWFLRQLATTDLDPVISLGHDGLEEVAGSGGQEIRAWLIGHAAVRTPLRWTSYEPVPEWITGMGGGATFEIA